MPSKLLLNSSRIASDSSRPAATRRPDAVNAAVAARLALNALRARSSASLSVASCRAESPEALVWRKADDDEARLRSRRLPPTLFGLPVALPKPSPARPRLLSLRRSMSVNLIGVVVVVDFSEASVAAGVDDVGMLG